MRIDVRPDGRVYRDSVFTGEIIKICGETPKYFVDCSEWMRAQFG
jgi:hypothetical protein